MTVPLATDIRIEHGDDTVRLIPSLRAAYLLNRTHGIDALVKAVDEGNVTVICAILAQAGSGAADALVLIEAMASELGSAAMFAAIHGPISEFLTACFVADNTESTDKQPEPRTSADPRNEIEKGLSSLYSIGTGWLGWSPETVWASSPAEIVTAQRGLIAKLKAIHGAADKHGSDQQPEIYSDDRLQEVEDLGFDPSFDRTSLADLKARIGGR